MGPYGNLSIWLVRHGETDFKKIKKIQGKLESRLNDVGLNQANKIAKIISSHKNCNLLHNIYSSPLLRCIQTSNILSSVLNIPVKKDIRLTELDRGVLEGKYKNNLSAEEVKYLELFNNDLWKYRIPGGETFSELEKRIANFFDEVLINHESNLIIVSHGYVLRMIIYLYLERKENIKNIKAPLDKCYLLERSNDTDIYINKFDLQT